MEGACTPARPPEEDGLDGHLQCGQGQGGRLARMQ